MSIHPSIRHSYIIHSPFIHHPFINASIHLSNASQYLTLLSALLVVSRSYLTYLASFAHEKFKTLNRLASLVLQISKHKFSNLLSKSGIASVRHSTWIHWTGNDSFTGKKLRLSRFERNFLSNTAKRNETGNEFLKIEPYSSSCCLLWKKSSDAHSRIGWVCLMLRLSVIHCMSFNKTAEFTTFSKDKAFTSTSLKCKLGSN